jgi:hypothetical protein
MLHTHRVVAAIDFGTHGSGYAWTAVDPRWRTSSDREIYDFTHWRDARDPTYPKTLSALLLKNDSLVAWGYPAARALGELKPGTAEAEGYLYLAGVKMSLRPADDLARGLQGTTGPAARLADPVPMIAIYLREIARLAIAEITRAGAYTEEDIRWCLTVPAIWDQRALNAMRDAAARAGLPSDKERLLLIPEPDAAALYCDVVGSRSSSEFTATGRGTLHPGTRFMVIDCGGGTVDLVSYEVTNDEKVDQLARPGGGPLGAEFTTRAFLFDALGKRFGGYVDLEKLERRHPRQFAHMAQQWEEQRNTFRDGETVPFYIDIARRLGDDLPAAAIERLRTTQYGIDDQIVLEPAEVRDLLDGVVEPILGHIDTQLSRWKPGPIDGDMAFLVGGFANSPYLQDRVTEHLQGRLPVRLAPRPERAVLFGAVHYCYDPTMLRARRARYTYGCNIAMPARPGDPKDYAVSRNGEAYTRNRFKIFVRVDEKVPVDREVVQTVIPLHPDQERANVTFYSTLDSDPEYVTDEGIRREAPLDITLGSETLKRPLEERELRIYMKFGEAQIQARVIDPTTGSEHKCTFLFESDL